MNSTLAIMGAGGHGKVVAETAICSGQWNKIAFFDDGKCGQTIENEWDVVGCFADLYKMQIEYPVCVVALGDNHKRLEIVKKLVALNFDLAIVIHPTAAISRFCSIGAGSVVFANSVVNVGATLGLACIVNSSSIVEHDCKLADGVHVCPGVAIAGGVSVGRNSMIGTGANVIPNIEIGSDVLVGAGSVVVRNVDDGLVVSGTPATENITSSPN